ncbi:MAG: SGNH/GDSL hydrolase family protein [Lachnospiraceae bacterium]|nr:SGNH/GDSL hydrolase family protein [Lachnospiraceae bacterium]
MKIKYFLTITAISLLLCGCGNQEQPPVSMQLPTETIATVQPDKAQTDAPITEATAQQTTTPTAESSTQPTQPTDSSGTESSTPTQAPTEAPAPQLTLAPAPESTTESTPKPVAVATDAPAHVPDFTPAPTEQPGENSSQIENSTDWYQHMIDSSILSTGSNGRLEKVIQKIQKGEDVSIMAFGGSITEGAGAMNFSYSYGEQFIFNLQETYTNSSIHYHNSGLGGTPSTLGLMRYERDVTEVIGGNPDLVIIEFAVNDYAEPTKGRAYESLVRTVLEKENTPAVILLFSVFQSKWNLQDSYIPIGEHYGLPMVSIKDAIATAYSSNHLTDAEYFADIYHPTNYGHEIMADCLTELFEQVASKDPTQPISPLPETDVYGADFQGIRLITAKDNAGATVAPGSFTGQDKALQSFSRTTKAAFPDNWQHSTDGGNESLRVELTCKNILLTYKYSSSLDFGKASVYIDGNYITELSGYLNGGWNNAETVLILDEDTSAPHVLEIKMSEGQENKKFTVLGIGYTP